MVKDSYEHYDGICGICHREKKVRWKNIYLVGSEGLDMCMDCERDMLRYLRNRSHEFLIKKKEAFKAARVKREASR